MGLPASKFGQEIEQEEPTQGSLPSTPILTPKTKLVELDPRSPSDSIARTPIEILAKTKTHILLNSSESSPVQNSRDTFNIYSPGVKLKSIDPRSPTIDFDRTPVLVPEDKVTLHRKLHNKNLDNVRKILTISPLAKSTKEMSSEKVVSPKLLESNIISPRPNENKRKSYVGLLETNLDFVETDLDKVTRNNKIDKKVEDKCSSSSKDSNKNSEEDIGECVSQIDTVKESTSDLDISSTEDVCVNDVVDPRSPVNVFVRTPIQILQKLDNLEIEDTSVKEVTHITQISTNCNDDNLQTTITHKSIARLKNSNTNTKLKPNIDDDKHRYQSKAETVRDFDKKLTNLIYEDMDKSHYLIKNKKLSEYKHRTPLKTRNSIAYPKNRVSKLKVHDKPQKSVGEFSRIPILQNKKARGKFNKQCENTPPKNVEENRKSGKYEWDPDNTLII